MQHPYAETGTPIAQLREPQPTALPRAPGRILECGEPWSHSDRAADYISKLIDRPPPRVEARHLRAVKKFAVPEVVVHPRELMFHAPRKAGSRFIRPGKTRFAIWSEK